MIHHFYEIDVHDGTYTNPQLKSLGDAKFIFEGSN